MKFTEQRFWSQRGTVVERLQEEIVRDAKHLRQILAICEGKYPNRHIRATTRPDGTPIGLLMSAIVDGVEEIGFLFSAH